MTLPVITIESIAFGRLTGNLVESRISPEWVLGSHHLVVPVGRLDPDKIANIIDNMRDVEAAAAAVIEWIKGTR